MKEKDIGDVLVVDEEGRLVGIVTDRDVAIRATAEGADPSATRVEGVYTRDITSLALTDSVHDAVRLMRARDIRRLPVVENGRAIGVVSLGTSQSRRHRVCCLPTSARLRRIADRTTPLPVGRGRQGRAPLDRSMHPLGSLRE
jgi:signal-transduction protein with cAMP-binding, CBS, and nucleotidyltransferase domain